MARRRSYLAKRVQKMRGLPVEEKQLLLRVGELVDAAINNRTPTNPNAPGRNRRDPKLPPPNTVTNEVGIRSAKLTWPAVDSSLLSHYRIVVTSYEEGTTEEFISYTNTFFFKGRRGGKYRAQVYSVGRNGTQSRATNIDFFVTDDVMLLEGARNDFNALGTQVYEDFFFTKGHVVFAWCSFTLDKLIGGSATGNSPATANLYRGDPTRPLNEATLLQTVTLFEATESATCLDNTALGGLTRPSLAPPASGDLTYARGTTFETCQSFMFGPISVDETTQNEEWRMWLEVIGREDEQDVTSLALTLWSANEGEADQIPGNLPSQEPGIVTNHRSCVEIHADNVGLSETGNADEYMRGRVEENFRTIGNVWTFACWIKFLAWPIVGENMVIFDSFSRQSDIAHRNFNEIVLTVSRLTGAGSTGIIRTRVSIGGGRSDPLDLTADTGSWRKDDIFNGLAASQTQDTEGLYTSPPNVWPLGLNDWWFFVMDYDVTNGINVYRPTTGAALTADIDSTASIDPPPDFDEQRDVVWGCAKGALYDTLSPFDYQGPTINGNNHAICRIYQAGMWDKKLSQQERLYLYNGGSAVDSLTGQIIHWRENAPLAALPYISAGNLTHYWQFGAVSTERQYVARDTGINPLGSGGGDGDIDCSEDDEIAQNFTVDNNVVDGDYPGA